MPELSTTIFPVIQWSNSSIYKVIDIYWSWLSSSSLTCYSNSQAISWWVSALTSWTPVVLGLIVRILHTLQMDITYYGNLGYRYVYFPSINIDQSWLVVTCCTAAVKTYEGLIACRIFLGVAEAGFFVSPFGTMRCAQLKRQPGIMCYLCFWYPPRIRGTRMAFFSASITIAGKAPTHPGRHRRIRMLISQVPSEDL